MKSALVRTRRTKFLITAFLWSSGFCFCTAECVEVEAEPGVVGSWHARASQRQISPKISGCHGAIFNYICLHGSLMVRHFGRVSNVKVSWTPVWLFTLRLYCKNKTNKKKNQTYESVPNQNWKDLIPCDLCCSHCYEKKTDLSHISAKRNQNWAIFACREKADFLFCYISKTLDMLQLVRSTLCTS